VVTGQCRLTNEPQGLYAGSVSIHRPVKLPTSNRELSVQRKLESHHSSKMGGWQEDGGGGYFPLRKGLLRYFDGVLKVSVTADITLPVVGPLHKQG